MVKIFYWYLKNILKYLIIKDKLFINKIMKQEIVFYIIILIVIVTLNRGGLLDNLRYIHINSGSNIFS